MATFRFQGLEEYERQLSKLAESGTIRAVCGATIFAGADIFADEIRKGINEIPVVGQWEIGTPDNPVEGITKAQKEGLLDSFGITPMDQENGMYNVKLGFDGYNSVKTVAYPQGQPNSLIARAVNSGTSFRKKIPFINKAIKAAKAPAEKAMAETFDKKLQEAMK